jgi:hypothetical protein
VIFKRPRIKNERHLNHIRSLPCCVCGDNTSTEAAHIRMSNLECGKFYTGKAEKPSDCWTVPLCGMHHREQHNVGEHTFWAMHKIDPFQVAAYLFASSGDYEAGENIIGAHIGNARTPIPT